jgi:hypothetical protein
VAKRTPNPSGTASTSTRLESRTTRQSRAWNAFGLDDTGMADWQMTRRMDESLHRPGHAQEPSLVAVVATLSLLLSSRPHIPPLERRLKNVGDVWLDDDDGRIGFGARPDKKQPAA